MLGRANLTFESLHKARFTPGPQLTRPFALRTLPHVERGHQRDVSCSSLAQPPSRSRRSSGGGDDDENLNSRQESIAWASSSFAPDTVLIHDAERMANDSGVSDHNIDVFGLVQNVGATSRPDQIRKEAARSPKPARASDVVILEGLWQKQSVSPTPLPDAPGRVSPVAAGATPPGNQVGALTDLTTRPPDAQGDVRNINNISTLPAPSTLNSPENIQHYSSLQQLQHPRTTGATSLGHSMLPPQPPDDMLHTMLQLQDDLNWYLEEHEFMAKHSLQMWKPAPHHPTPSQLWDIIRKEAAQDALAEPKMASSIHASILMHPSLAEAQAHILSNQLSGGAGSVSCPLHHLQLLSIMLEAFSACPDILDAMRADLVAVKDRDPACKSYVQVLTRFKGFQAVGCHRVAHWLWIQGRKALARTLQACISQVFHVDIHPGARLGRGLLLDHATGVVIGESAVVGDNVVMLHRVTLGGSGGARGLRHPLVGHGALLGAGTTVMGPLIVGAGSKVGAGSLVHHDLPQNCVAVGVPAKVVKQGPPIDQDPHHFSATDFMVESYLDFQI